MSAIERLPAACVPECDVSASRLSFPPFHTVGALEALHAAGLRLQAARSGLREELEALIRTRYAQAYQARVHHFMPCLLALQDASGHVLGGAGVRAAGRGALFLERYLDAPVEAAMSGALNVEVARDEVVEVGQLVGLSAGAFRNMISLVTARLHAAGYRWVVFTGTRALRNAFARLGLQPRSLGIADPACLALGERADWGTYYAHAPEVLCGDIREGFRALMRERAQ